MDTAIVAARIVRAMEAKGYRVDREPGQVNIVYVEGVSFKDTDGVLIAAANGNKPNEWNDVRIVLQFEDGKPTISDWWPATTEPGTRYTMAPIATDGSGAARITLGQQSCWQVGTHRGYEALAQQGAAVMVTRDQNKDYKRAGDKVTKGFYGINQHHGFDAPMNDIGPHSAGCLVGRTVKGHQEFMALVKTDPRYKAGRQFVYTTTILEASEILDVVAKPASRPAATAPAKMILKLTHDAVRKCFPGAPEPIVDAFVSKQVELAKAGILDTPERLAFCFANLAHESNNFTIPGLTENINYSASRAAEVWPSRFHGAADVASRYGSSVGWQEKMFDDIYGSRMGNRPGTDDGSKFIGRGGPQITGRDGYAEIGKLTELPLEANPSLAGRAEHQPAIAAAFWSWKKLNALADRNDFEMIVVRWNGGTNGMADRKARLARILPIAKSLERVSWSPEATAATAVIVVSTSTAVATKESEWTMTDVAMAGFCILVAAVVAATVIRKIRRKS